MFEEQSDEQEAPGAEGMTRRQALGGTVGAFALAASGLFLPAGMESAEARKGRYGGKLGGRHGKNRRGRDKRDRKKDRNKGKSSDGKALGGSLIRYVGCKVASNDSTWDDLQVDFYYRIKGVLDTWSSLKFARTVSLRDAVAEYRPDRYSIAVYIRASNMERGCLVEMRNDLIFPPEANVVIGGSVNPSGDYVGGSSKGWWSAYYEPLVHTIGNATFPNGVAPVDVSVREVDQTKTHKWFQIYLVRGASH